MTIANFIPSVWAAEILRQLDPLLVYANPAIINTDYEGEISQFGDSVRISMVGDVTVKDYTANADIDPPEQLTDAQLQLLIDQAKYFNFAVDDIDRRQMNAALREEAARRAAIGLRQRFDGFVSSHYTDIATGNFIGSDGAPRTGFSADSKLAYNLIAKLGTKLNDNEVDEEGRWVVVPNWYAEYLLLDDRAISFGTPQNRAQMAQGTSTADNGLIGQAAGFDVYRSTAVPNVAGARYKVIAGHRSAWSRAQQILETEAYRPERRFADALKGLHVYGAKVVRPNSLACLVASDA
jgi:hypothetical protein